MLINLSNHPSSGWSLTIPLYTGMGCEPTSVICTLAIAVSFKVFLV